jgi:hypothetical protein
MLEIVIENLMKMTDKTIKTLRRGMMGSQFVQHKS